MPDPWRPAARSLAEMERFAEDYRWRRQRERDEAREVRRASLGGLVKAGWAILAIPLGGWLAGHHGYWLGPGPTGALSAYLAGAAPPLLLLTLLCLLGVTGMDGAGPWAGGLMLLGWLVLLSAAVEQRPELTLLQIALLGLAPGLCFLSIYLGMVGRHGEAYAHREDIGASAFLAGLVWLLVASVWFDHYRNPANRSAAVPAARPRTAAPRPAQDLPRP